MTTEITAKQLQDLVLTTLREAREEADEKARANADRYDSLWARRAHRMTVWSVTHAVKTHFGYGNATGVTTARVRGALKRQERLGAVECVQGSGNRHKYGFVTDEDRRVDEERSRQYRAAKTLVAHLRDDGMNVDHRGSKLLISVEDLANLVGFNLDTETFEDSERGLVK